MPYPSVRPALCALLFALGADVLASDVPLGADTYLSTASPGANYGSAATLNVGPGATALLRFDRSALPQRVLPVQVLKATLVLYVNRVGISGAVDVRRVAAQWNESGVTASTAPATLVGDASTAVIGSTGRYLTIDVTDQVAAWIGAAGADNLALALSPSAAAPNTSVFFDSKENTGTSHAARLDLVFAARGIPGPQGPDGMQGAPGLPGPAGPAGAAGPQGPRGDSGLAGLAGAAGATGANGAKGPGGDTGVVGAAGAAGPQGAKGATGAQGQDGAAGAAGTPGPVGARGNPGPAGLAGARGIAGPVGAGGDAGPAGPTGGTGAAGPQGSAGNPGTVGARGPDGLMGPVGPQGPAGPLGPTGTQRGPKGTLAATFGQETGNRPTGSWGVECIIGELLLTAGVGSSMPAAGQTLRASDYQELYSVIGAQFNGEDYDDRETFKLPDLRTAAPNGTGYFICTSGRYPHWI